jgi:hypothetical protein
MELRPHQEIALQELRNGSVLAGGVGVGKTITALAYYVQIVCGGVLDRSEPMRHPKDLIVITTAKKRNSLDWEKEGLKLGLSIDPELSYSGREFVIDSWNNMKKHVDREDCFFVFDEQRLVGAGAWVKSFLKIVKRNQWILLSATPADTWMDYVPLFIAHGFYRNRTDFVEKHVVWSFNGKYRKIRGFFGVRSLERERDSILVHMPYERHTTRHLVAVPVVFDREAFDMVWKRRWHVYEGRPLIDVAEMHRVARRLVNTDGSRMDAIVELGAKHPRMIIYYTHDYELEDLRTLMTKMDICIAEWNGHRHEEIPETERWLYLVQYQAGSEAWNCTETDTIVYYSLTYSHKLFEQSQGRIDRLDTPYEDLWYYILMSESRIDKLIWKALVAKKNFHEGRNVKFNSPDKDSLP